MAAIDAIALTGKPVAEVSCRKVRLADLENDLAKCLELAGEVGNVRPWTKIVGARVRYGFYREQWVLDALNFLDRTELSDVDRSWISGLLFGYRPDAIQQYISRTNPSTSELPDGHTEPTTENSEAVAGKSM